MSTVALRRPCVADASGPRLSAAMPLFYALHRIRVAVAGAVAARLCRLTGHTHELRFHCVPGRMSLQCPECGYETPGIEIGRGRPRRKERRPSGGRSAVRVCA